MQQKTLGDHRGDEAALAQKCCRCLTVLISTNWAVPHAKQVLSHGIWSCLQSTPEPTAQPAGQSQSGTGRVTSHYSLLSSAQLLRQE